MQKFIFIESITKEYLHMRQRLHSQRKTIEIIKLLLSICLVIVMLAWYAYSRISGSTMGYNLQQSQNIHYVAAQNNMTLINQSSTTHLSNRRLMKDRLVEQEHIVGETPFRIDIDSSVVLDPILGEYSET